MVFVSSDYTRALQTAEQCRAAMKNILSFEHEGVVEEDLGFLKPIVIRQEIREREFGELDGTPQANYSKVLKKRFDRHVVIVGFYMRLPWIQGEGW